MAVSIRQSATAAGLGAGITVTLGMAPVAGNVLVMASVERRGTHNPGSTLIGGNWYPNLWTQAGPTVDDSNGDGASFWYRVSDGTETTFQLLVAKWDVTIWELAGAAGSPAEIVSVTNQGAATTMSVGAFSASPGVGLMVITSNLNNAGGEFTAFTGWTERSDGPNTEAGADADPHHFTADTTTATLIKATAGGSHPFGGIGIRFSAASVALPSCGVSPMLFDVYKDNADGTLTYIDTLCTAKGKQVRIELDGTGSGEFTINRGSAEATTANLGTGADITRLVKVRIPDVSANAVFAFWIENGDFGLLSSQEAGDEDLKFSGRGALAYLDRGIMSDHSFISGGQDPYDNEWRGFAAGTGAAPGQILWRVVRELQEASRVIGATASHPIPALVMDFDVAWPGTPPTNDSNGAAWTTSATTADFVEAVGERVLSVVGRLIATGVLTVQCSPDLILSGYNTFGTTRTNGSFAAGKVRFVEAVNIRDSLARQIRGGRQATHELVAGSGADIYGHAQLNASTKPHWEAFQSSNSASVTALNGIGLTDLTQRLLRSESLQVPVLCGNDELNGLYLPGPSGTHGHYWVGDTISLHTGTGDFDVTNVAVRVAAITISEPDYAAAVTDLSIVTELNSTNIIAQSITGGDYGGGGITSSTGGGGGSGGSSGVTVKDEGVALATAAATLDFVGSGVAASGTGSTKTITISGSPNAELNIEGGQDVIKAHGSMGATETFDPTDGNVHTGTLDANCTFTLNAPVGTGACTLELWLTQDATGGRTITWPGSVTVQGTLDTTLSMTSRVVLETIDGGTNWIANVVGSGSSLTVKDEGGALATAATSIDFVGAGVVASGAGAAKTVTIAGVTAAAITALGFVGPILMTDGISSPPEPLTTEDGTDYLTMDL